MTWRRKKTAIEKHEPAPDEDTENHAIRVVPHGPLPPGSYYVRRMVLVEGRGRQFAARAVLVPWAEVEAPPPIGRRGSEVEAVVYHDSGIYIPTLSILNLLLLQGRRVQIRRAGGLAKDDHASYIAEIEALTGRTFEQTLAREYHPSEGGGSPPSS